MKQKSNTKPNQIEIDVVGDMALVSLFDEIEEIETEDGFEYEYYYYMIEVINQDNLETIIAEDIDTWIEFAKENAYE